ncbi:acyltransferase family protein [Tunturiibacter lichenicola]|uniref:acyltransferase family protein n=1 Tax=Tunturiibacter lichenicola TaxID=2051959 RepID=UPI003D9B7A9B
MPKLAGTSDNFEREWRNNSHDQKGKRRESISNNLLSVCIVYSLAFQLNTQSHISTTPTSNYNFEMPEARNIPVELSGHRFLEFDSLRGLAAATVVVGHLMYLYRPVTPIARWLYLLPSNFLLAGGSAVILFFTLSGFVLTLPYKRSKHASYLAYLVKRFCRLYLPFAAALLLTVFIRAHSPSPVVIGQDWLDGTWNTPVRAHDVFYQLTGVGNFNPYLFNGVYWTLAVEMRISLIMPAIAWLALRMRFSIGLAASLLTAGFLTWLAPHVSHRLIPVTLRYACLFLNGALFATNFDLVGAWWRNRSSVVRSSLTIAAVLVFGYASEAVHTYSLLQQALSLASIVLMLNASQSRAIRHWLHRPAILHAGAISYSLYLTHLIVLLWIVHTFWGRMHALYVIPGFILASFILAEFFHYSVEKPTIKLGRFLERLVLLRSLVKPPSLVR